MTGDDLRRVRQAMGLTQAQLGHILGYATKTIANMETGQNPIPYTQARRHE